MGVTTAGTATMLAARKRGPEPGLSVERVPVPDCGPDEVLVRVTACGICGSDLGKYRWTGHAPRVLRGRLPVTLGHEVAGEVVRVGDRVEGLAGGQPVAVEPTLSCGRCRQCLAGRENICAWRRRLGTEVQGGLAEYVTVPASAVYPLPASIPAREAAVLEIAATAVHAVTRVPVARGDTAVVIGAGPFGLLLLQLLVAAGARTVVVGSPRAPRRLELARAFGAEAVVQAGVGAAAGVSEALGGEKADYAYEAAGTSEAIRLGLDVVQPGGTLALLGSFDGVAPIHPYSDVMSPEVTIASARGRTRDAWQRTILLVSSGTLRVGPLIDLEVPLARASEGFEALLAGSVIKAVIRP